MVNVHLLFTVLQAVNVTGFDHISLNHYNIVAVNFKMIFGDKCVYV